MDIGAPEVGIFVSLVAVLALALIALSADLMKGNMETLRQENLRLRTRDDLVSRFMSIPPDTADETPSKPEAKPAPATRPKLGQAPIQRVDVGGSAPLALPPTAPPAAPDVEEESPPEPEPESAETAPAPTAAPEPAESEPATAESPAPEQPVSPAVEDRPSLGLPALGAESSRETDGPEPALLPMTRTESVSSTDPPTVWGTRAKYPPAPRLPYKIWCEGCGSWDIYVSRKQSRILHFFGLVAHRCLRCNARFYMYPEPFNKFSRGREPAER